MATVVSVYEVAPHYRTAKQILGINEETLPERPKPENKRVWANITDDIDDILNNAN